MENLFKPLLETYTENALNRVNWENFSDEDGTPWKLGDAYWNKLEWLKEYLLELEIDGDDRADEMLDIVNDLQETIVPILNELDKF